jgi:hypothetical protein
MPAKISKRRGDPLGIPIEEEAVAHHPSNIWTFTMPNSPTLLAEVVRQIECGECRGAFLGTFDGPSLLCLYRQRDGPAAG